LTQFDRSARLESTNKYILRILGLVLWNVANVALSVTRAGTRSMDAISPDFSFFSLICEISREAI